MNAAPGFRSGNSLRLPPIFLRLRAAAQLGAPALRCALLCSIFCTLLCSVPAAVFGGDCDGVSPADGSEIRAELVTDGLHNPVGVAAPPLDTERLFVVEQQGQIRIVNLADDSLRVQPFLDIHTKTRCCGEEGLLGLAFHPHYAENRYFYIFYAKRSDGNLTVERYEARSDDPNSADPASAKTILGIYHPVYGNHNGGQLAFGPFDGYLYIGVGDGGGDGTPSQDPLNLLGKILRIDVDGGDPYVVPPTNPFAMHQDVLPEIWALGLRNPWRFSFDPENGDLYIGDVGQGAWEEVDWQSGASEGGENYGWRQREGSRPYSSSDLGPGKLTSPVFEYPHGTTGVTGCSVTGGVVYRGCRMPELRGAYFVADFCTNWVATFRMEDGVRSELELRTAEVNSRIVPYYIDEISSFGVDARGEVYICDLPGANDQLGALWRIVPKLPGPIERRFRRGDANGDGSLGISDAVYMLRHLFRGEPEQVPCDDALDTNDSGDLDVSDAVYGLLHLFLGGPAPPIPNTGCGLDPSDDNLDCRTDTCL